MGEQITDWHNFIYHRTEEILFQFGDPEAKTIGRNILFVALITQYSYHAKWYVFNYSHRSVQLTTFHDLTITLRRDRKLADF